MHIRLSVVKRKRLCNYDLICIMKTLGERIAHYRKLCKLTQAALGATVGLDQTVISKLEKGDMHETSKVARIARALKVDAYWLDTGEGEPTPFYAQTAEGRLAAMSVDGMHSRQERQRAVKIIDTIAEPAEGTNGNK